MQHRKAGFTLVEILIILAVIGILTAIGTLAYITFQQDARDSQRSTKAALIAEGLEKYYDKNGEYPSPVALTNNIAANTGATVSSKLSVNQETLLMPKAASNITNSIAPTLGNNDVIAYVAKSDINNNSCQTVATSGCDEFTLTYQEERSGEIITIKSRHNSRATGFETSPEAPARPTITAAQSGTSIIATSSVPACETGLTAKYSFQNKAGTGAWTAWSAWQTGRTWTRTGNSSGIVYQFQVKVRCDSSTKDGIESAASAPVSITYVHVVTAPSTPSVTATSSGANVVATSSIVTCQTGETVQYKIDHRVNSGAWTEGTWGTGRIYTVASAAQGSIYGFRATARCVLGSDIATSGTSPEVTYTVAVTAPSGLTISAAMSGANAVGTAAGGSCGTGATIERQIRYHSTSTSADGTWSGYVTGTTRSIAANQGHKYTFQQQARCVGASTNSAWVASSTASTVRSIAIPSTPSISVSTSGTTTTYTRNSVTCPSGTTTRYQYKYIADWGYDTGWYGPTTGVATVDWSTGNQGYQYQVQMQAQCYTVHTTSGWSGTGTGSYIRPVAAPGAPTSFSGSVSSNRRVFTHTWTAPTCGPSTIGYSSHNPYVIGSGSNTWYFADTGQSGWKGWGALDYWSASYTITQVGSAPNIPSGGKAQIQVRYLCRNNTTGRQSGYGPTGTSPLYNT